MDDPIRAGAAKQAADRGRPGRVPAIDLAPRQENLMIRIEARHFGTPRQPKREVAPNHPIDPGYHDARHRLRTKNGTVPLIAWPSDATNAVHRGTVPFFVQPGSTW
jgi:hypothetical protein